MPRIHALMTWAYCQAKLPTRSNYFCIGIMKGASILLNWILHEDCDKTLVRPPPHVETWVLHAFGENC